MIKVTLCDGTVIVGDSARLDGYQANYLNLDNPHNWGGMVQIPTQQVRMVRSTENWADDPIADIFAETGAITLESVVVWAFLVIPAILLILAGFHPIG